MLKKVWKSFTGFFFAPKLNDVQPAIHNRGITVLNDTNKHQNNAENIALAELQLQRDALQKNLIVMHRTMLVALFAVLVSVILGIYAVKSKPNVTVKVYEQKTIQTTN